MQTTLDIKKNMVLMGQINGTVYRFFPTGKFILDGEALRQFT